VRTLNDIPEHLREPAKPTWTPRRGLIRGTVWTAVTALTLGAILCGVTHVAAPVTTHWLLSMAWACAITWLLFAVMHKASGMVCWSCTLIVLVCACLILVARQLTLLGLVTAVPGETGSAGSVLQMCRFLLINGPAWVGMSAAAFICHDGDSSPRDLIDFFNR
jgi:hypothetical protein